MLRGYNIAMLVVLLSCGRAAAFEGLPEFKLNKIKADKGWDAETGIFIPPASPPVLEKGAAAAEWSPPLDLSPKKYPLYRPYEAGIIRFSSTYMRTRSGSGGEHGTDNITFTGRTTVALDGRKGRAEIKFPEAEFEDELPGDEVLLFVKASGDTLPPELSWAAVICSGRGYLGYKGSSLKLPGESGNFTLVENVAVGGRKAQITKTHPWLAGRRGGDDDLNRLCSPDFRRKMKDFTVRTLPGELDSFHLNYNPAQNTLNIAWKMQNPAPYP